ncbi:hypothetical protein ACGFIF_44090 [Kribbella sp. NPDC049174]|uniref:hypothetical protein n=1 Tax=Kribbella sp. NPDC049174 TaxID=3364112 RepID=UPI003716C23B
MLSVLVKVVIGFLLIGVLGVWVFLGFNHYVVFMLSPFPAPLVVPWAARVQEKLADQAAADLGYGALLAEVFTGREYERAQSWATAPRQGLKATSRSTRPGCVLWNAAWLRHRTTTANRTKPSSRRLWMTPSWARPQGASCCSDLRVLAPGAAHPSCHRSSPVPGE